MEIAKGFIKDDLCLRASFGLQECARSQTEYNAKANLE